MVQGKEKYMIQKKITIISGSPRKEKSLSLKRAIELAEKTGYPYTIFSAADWNVQPCRGCGKCFLEGQCVMEEADDMGRILESLKDSLAVIYVSPVYVGTVTGQMKLLIDRLAVQHHLLPLIGIPAVSVAVANSNHLKETVSYLTKSLELMGASVVNSLEIASVLPYDENQITEIADQLKRAIEGKKPLTYSEYQREVFHIYNKKNRIFCKYEDQFPYLFGEAAKWHQMGYDQCKDIDEASERKRNNENI